MDNLTVRRAATSDVEPIVELRLLAQKHFEEANPLIWRITDEGKELCRQKVEDDITNSNVRVLLAVVDGEPVGYAQGEVTSRSNYLPKTTGQVSHVYVVKQWRRKGVGARLLGELCRFFDVNKAEDLTVRYVVGNHEAEEFWRKLGFKSTIATGKTSPRELGRRLKAMARTTARRPRRLPSTTTTTADRNGLDLLEY